MCVLSYRERHRLFISVIFAGGGGSHEGRKTAAPPRGVFRLVPGSQSLLRPVAPAGTGGHRFRNLLLVGQTCQVVGQMCDVAQVPSTNGLLGPCSTDPWVSVQFNSSTVTMLSTG